MDGSFFESSVSKKLRISKMKLLFRTAEAQIEYVEEAESSWAEFWVEDNAEIYDDLEVVYSDIKIESLRRKPNIKRKCSPVVENMTNRLTENIFEGFFRCLQFDVFC